MNNEKDLGAVSATEGDAGPCLAPAVQLPHAETCVYCGKPSEGNYAIHRDGFGVGPEVPLCDACGSDSEPECAEIWEKIAQPADDECAYFRVNRTAQ